ENLENSARDAKPPLGRLVGIGGCSDHDGFAGEQLEVLVAAESESPAQYFGRVFLDEDVPLKREPRRKLVVGFVQNVGHFFFARRPFHDVAMGVPRVAVRAAESAANVWV